jgi:restriction system protein
MNVRDAAEQVLRDAGSPLHAREITERILTRKLWEPQGKTPAATVSARLYSNIKKCGDKSRFVLTAPQICGLRELGAKPAAAVRPPPAKAAAEPQPPTASTVYSFTDAAEKALEMFGNKRPMHYKDIAKKALDQGWLDTEGKTPEATMAAQLYTAIKRAQRRGEQPRFIQHGRGVFGLGKWMGHGLSYEIEQHNRQVRQALRKRLLGLKPKEFEEMIGLLLVEMGFEDIEVVGRTGDGGIDVRAMLVVGDVIRIRMAIQAKKWKLGNNVQAPDVQRVRGSLGTHDQGLIITTSDFSPGARREAERADAVPVALMNGEQLALLLAEHEVGVTRRSHEMLELSEATSTSESEAGRHDSVR